LAIGLRQGVLVELDALDSVRYVFLRELSEPRDNALRLVVQEAVQNPAAVALPRVADLPEVAALRRNATPIQSTVNCRTFELTWKRYVSNSVTEECVGSSGNYDDEVFTGKLFRIYSRSHFLEHIARDTGGHTDAIRHYKLVCLNHLIDVAAYSPPEVRLIESPLATDNRVQ
jgi:hypothetical protein